MSFATTYLLHLCRCCVCVPFPSLISLLTSAHCLRSYKSKPLPPPLVGFNYHFLSSVSQSLLLPSDSNNAKTIYSESRSRVVPKEPAGLQHHTEKQRQ